MPLTCCVATAAAGVAAGGTLAFATAVACAAAKVGDNTGAAANRAVPAFASASPSLARLLEVLGADVVLLAEGRLGAVSTALTPVESASTMLLACVTASLDEPDMTLPSGAGAPLPQADRC
jgi:hypothetical protein